MTFKIKKAQPMKEILRMLGDSIFEYICNKNDGDKYNNKANFNEADAYIRKIRIVSIKYKYRLFKKDALIIKCFSPGVLIGYRGNLIDHLIKTVPMKAVEKGYRDFEILIQEERELDSIFSFMYGYPEDVDY